MLPAGAIGPEKSAPAAPASGPQRPFWRSLIADHAAHVAVVAAASLLDSGIVEERGPRASPLFLGSPPSFDERIRDRFRRGAGDTDAHGFVEGHVTPLTRGIALAAILGSNGSRWRDDVTDALGLWEAQRFNVAATGIVKNMVGRERPRLEFAEEDGATPAEIRRLSSSVSMRQSFYSYHASSAFTTLAYADLVLSRRLRSRPAARRWSRAVLYSLGATMAWARVLQDGHYLTDVAAGSLAGILTGRSFYAFNHHDGVDRWLSWDPRPSRRITLLPPVVTPERASLTARIGF